MEICSKQVEMATLTIDHNNNADCISFRVSKLIMKSIGAWKYQAIR